MKYVNDFIKEFEKYPAFTSRDAHLALMKLGGGSTYTERFLAMMTKSGKLYKITRGYYSVHDDPYVAGYAFAPFYYGLATALTQNNLWEQETNPVIISATKAMPRTLRAFNTNISIRRIDKKMFFGYKEIYINKFPVPISNTEKTLIDIVYFNYKVEEYVYENIANKIDRDVLGKYLKKCSARLKTRVLSLLVH